MGKIGNEPQKHKDFTEEEIKQYLSEFKDLVRSRDYTIAQNENRIENIEFIETYKIDSEKEREILLSLEYDDFCYAVDNKKKEFAHEKLYVFCKVCPLDNWGELENVEVYIKSNITQTRKKKDFMIVISFHKRNKPITYLFKK
ncbi:hypothetical protein V5F90_22385 [Priestia aryabhattai]